MPTIAPLTTDQISDIEALERDCFPHGPWSRASIAETLSRQTSLALAARDDNGHAEGYIILSIVGSEAEILRLGVSPALRRIGIGKALVRSAVGMLRARGCSDVFLECRVSNSAAVGLYTGEGFRVEGIRASYYRAPEEDAAVLRLVL